MNTPPRNTDLIASLVLGIAIAEAVPVEDGIPAGHLYAALMNHLTLEQFNGALAGLEKIEVLVTNYNHVTRAAEYEPMMAKMRRAKENLNG